jgi:amino-acid N-acetyltransferase
MTHFMETEGFHVNAVRGNDRLIIPNQSCVHTTEGLISSKLNHDVELPIMEIKVTLRPATETDQPKIRNLVWDARLNPTGLDWRRFIVAVDEYGEVIGCAQIKPHRDGTYEMASLVVSPGFQNRGVARMILDRLIQDHHGDLYLMCRASLAPFYQKFGFRAVSEPEMPHYFLRISRLVSLTEVLRKDGDSLLIMQLDTDRGTGSLT